MSEYYEFQGIDRHLDKAAQEALRSILAKSPDHRDELHEPPRMG
jgi:hypothetical protein